MVCVSWAPAYTVSPTEIICITEDWSPSCSEERHTAVRSKHSKGLRLCCGEGRHYSGYVVSLPPPPTPILTTQYVLCLYRACAYSSD